jgi:hypothetical protein
MMQLRDYAQRFARCREAGGIIQRCACHWILETQREILRSKIAKTVKDAALENKAIHPQR